MRLFLSGLLGFGLTIRQTSALDSIPACLPCPWGSWGSNGAKPLQFTGRLGVISDKAVYISSSLFLTQWFVTLNTAAGLMLKPAFSQGTASSAVRETLKNVLPNCCCLIKGKSMPDLHSGCTREGRQAKLGGESSDEAWRKVILCGSQWSAKCCWAFSLDCKSCYNFFFSSCSSSAPRRGIDWKGRRWA